jgi:glycosyltransferase involved in cell wall biosynthesis
MNLDGWMILLSVYAVALALLTTVQIAGAAIYDAKTARDRRQRRLHPYAKPYRRRPLVSIVILGQDQAHDIEGCLESLRRSSYRRLQIIIVDNHSRDDTKARVRRYLEQYSKLPARLIARRSSANRNEMIRSARRHIEGELVLVMDASSRIDRHAIRNLVRCYQDSPTVELWQPNVINSPGTDLWGLLSSYTSLLSQRPRKAASLLGWSGTSRYIICRYDALSKITGRKPVSLSSRYAPDVKLTGQDAAQPFRLQQPKNGTGFMKRVAQLVGIGQLVVTLLTPVLVSYFLYLAVALKEPLFLLLTMAGLALLLLFAIWENECFSFRQRLTYTIGIPVTYGWFYIRAVIGLLALGKGLLNDAPA